jgi:AhpD family alkylhydroperoxidase
MNDNATPRRAPPCDGENPLRGPIWTLAALSRALPGLPADLSRTLPTLLGRTLSNALRERIMIAVATENRCRYCRIAHATFGRASGLDEEEIARLLDGEDPALAERERLALAYARDLARRGFESEDRELRACLAARFSEDEISAIEATARLMDFANRFGNTFDELWARLRGAPGCAPARAGSAPSGLDLLAVSMIFVGAAAVVAPLVGALRLGQTLSGRS